MFPRQRVDWMTSISPSDISPYTGMGVWAVDNTGTPSSASIRTLASSRASVRYSPLSSDSTPRIRVPARRGSITSSHLFQSASAPSHGHIQQTRSASSMASRRAASVSLSDDRDHGCFFGLEIASDQLRASITDKNLDLLILE